jgi:hypothetical protein
MNEETQQHEPVLDEGTHHNDIPQTVSVEKEKKNVVKISILIFLLVIFILGAWYVLYNSNRKNVQSLSPAEENKIVFDFSDGKEVSGVAPLEDLLGVEDAYTCRFHKEATHPQKTTETLLTDGELFSNGEKTFMKFTYSDTSWPVTYELFDGEYVYTWMTDYGSSPDAIMYTDKIRTDVAMHALRMQTKQVKIASELLPEEMKDEITVTTQFSYTCTQWEVDESVLTKPAKGSFEDISTEVLAQWPLDPQEIEKICEICRTADTESDNLQKNVCLQTYDCT